MEAYFPYYKNLHLEDTEIAKAYGADNISVRDGRVWIRKPSSKIRLNPLKLLHEQEIHEQNTEKVAKDLYAEISSHVRHVMHDQIGKVKDTFYVATDLGVMSDMKQVLNDLLLNPHHGEDIIAKKLLPKLYKDFGIRYVTPIVLDMGKQQTIFAILKLHSITKLFPDQQLDNPEVRKRFLDREVFSGIEMKAGLPILYFVNCYTQINPIVFTYPVCVMNTAFHFYHEAVRPLLHDHRSSFASLFHHGVHPLIETDDRPIVPLERADHDITWKMLRFGVDSINRVFTFANDLFNFVSPTNEFETVKQLQFFATLHLLYSDIHALNATNDLHVKATLAFGAISKLSNLCFSRSIHANKATEETFFALLLSTKTSEYALKTISDSAPSGIKDFLSDLTRDIYCRFHKKLEMILPQDTENERLWDFRFYRNHYAHGAFLRKDNFETIFSNTSGHLPLELFYMPYILLVAFSLDPDGFFNFANQNVVNFNLPKKQQS